MTDELLLDFLRDDSILDLTQQSDVSDLNTTQLPLEWFNTDINGYYKNNLKIGHLNVNSIYGKANEVHDVLNQCMFDILIISESKIDSSVSNMLFAHSQYRIIRRDRSKGAGGLLVYIRSTITAHRQVKLEPEGIESICLDVKGYGNNWFMVCACYRSVPASVKSLNLFPHVCLQQNVCTPNVKRFYSLAILIWICFRGKITHRVRVKSSLVFVINFV